MFIPLIEHQELFRPSHGQISETRRRSLQLRARAGKWTDAQRQEYWLRNLRHVLRHAQMHVPYYRDLFAKIGFNAEADFTFEDFAHLPVLDRDQVIENEEELIATDIPRSLLRGDATGGSTGQPVRLWLGPEELGWRESGPLYWQQAIGFYQGAKVALLWGHYLDAMYKGTFRNRLGAWAQNHRWYNSFCLSPALLEEYHQDMQAWRPHLIVAYASALASLAQHLAEHGYQASYPSIGCVTGAEKLFPQQRELAERVFGRVYERYGARDTGLIASQVVPAGDFHVDWAHLLVEPETSEPESSVLITKFHADGTAMIRYRIGDVARFPAGSRPGHPATTLHEIVGRITDKIFRPDGGWVSGLHFPHMMKEYPVREFRFVQQRDLSLDLEIVPLPGFSGEHQKAMQATIEDNLPGLPLRVSLVQTIETTRANKLRPVVSYATEKAARL